MWPNDPSSPVRNALGEFNLTSPITFVRTKLARDPYAVARRGGEHANPLMMMLDHLDTQGGRNVSFSSAGSADQKMLLAAAAILQGTARRRAAPPNRGASSRSIGQCRSPLRFP